MRPEPLGFRFGGLAGGGIALGLDVGGLPAATLRWAKASAVARTAASRLHASRISWIPAGRKVAVLRVVQPELFARDLQVKAQHLADQPALGLGDRHILAVDQPIAAQGGPRQGLVPGIEPEVLPDLEHVAIEDQLPALIDRPGFLETTSITTSCPFPSSQTL